MPLQIVIDISGLEPGQHSLNVRTFGDLRNNCEAEGPIFDIKSGHQSETTDLDVVADEVENGIRELNNTRLSLYGPLSILGRGLSVQTLNGSRILACGVIGLARSLSVPNATTYTTNATASEMNATVPGVNSTPCGVNTIVPSVNTTGVNATTPRVNTTVSKVNATVPGVNTPASKVNTTAPGVNATASEVNTTAPGVMSETGVSNEL